MTLTHYAATPVTFDPTRVYDQNERHGYQKPHGLWVSVDGEDDWKSWCVSESHWPEGLAHTYRVTLVEKPNTLLIRDGLGLESFHASYAVESDSTRRMRREKLDFYGHDFIFRQRPVEWQRVVKEYDGLIIAPYLWSHRLHGPHWYYGWDCASGCIWNLSAVKSFEERQA